VPSVLLSHDFWDARGVDLLLAVFWLPVAGYQNWVMAANFKTAFVSRWSIVLLTVVIFAGIILEPLRCARRPPSAC
jgi:hypothetical protein